MRRTLYVSRPLLNADDLVTWAKAQGFGKTLTADDMHVTVAFSRAAVDWDELDADVAPVTVAGGTRAMKPLGDEGAIVLRFDSDVLADRWQQLCDAGASWDYPSYQPHVTITYDGADVDLDEVDPFDGDLVFGPEEFAEIEVDKSTFAAPASATGGVSNYDLDGARRRRRKRRNKAADATTTEAAPPAMEKSAMSALKLFIPITKIDAAQRLVYGVATAELPDVSGEVCDYASTKPNYEKWSAQFAKTTDGKSLGNLRAMHGNVAAGKLTQIAFDDDAKKIEICGKVVDEAEWAKVEQGVYTGFSQGGRYVKRWKDPDNDKLTRYTADPVEVSLVDSPCLPEATFSVIKADGSTEMRKFKPVASPAAPSAADVTAKAVELAKAAGDETKWADHIAAAAAALAAPPAAPEAPPVAKVETTPTDGEIGEQVWVNLLLPGKTFKKKAELRQALVDHAAQEAAAKTAAPVLAALETITNALTKQGGGDAGAVSKTKTNTGAGDGDVAVIIAGGGVEKFNAALKAMSDDELRLTLLAMPIAMLEQADRAVAKRTYSADEREKYAGQGIAMKDGSFPIPDKDALKDAIDAFGRAKNKAATKRHITKRAKALKATDMLPADWPGSTKDKDASKVAGDGDLKKTASLYSLANLIQLLAAIESAEEDFEFPGYGLGMYGGAAVPKELCDRFGALLVELGDIIAAALDVILAAMKEEEAGEALANAALIADLKKLAGDRALIKAGAKHSKADKSRIKQAHDLLVDLDDDCCPGGDAEDDDAEKLAKKLGAQLDAERTAHAKLLSETMMPAIAKITEQLGKMDVTLTAVAEQPLPIGTSSVSLRVVEKSDDAGLEERAQQLKLQIQAGTR